MARLSISELETLSGIKAHTIRIWEQRYQFLKPRRTETNIRYYCPDELKLLLDIALLNKKGLKVSQINSLTREDIRRQASQSKDAALRLENLVNEMIGAMVDLDMERFEEIVDEESRRNGVEVMVKELLFPFLVKSQLLWKVGHLNEASEQLASHLIRQKLIVAIELATARQTKQKTYLLFLPENDHRELGLLFFYYIMKSQGYNTIYLGDNVPLSDLEHITELKKPDELFTHIISGGKPFRTDKYVKLLGTRLADIPVTISGMPEHLPKKWPANVRWEPRFEVN